MGYQFYFTEMKAASKGEFPGYDSLQFDQTNYSVYTNVNSITPNFNFFVRNSCRESMYSNFKLISNKLIDGLSAHNNLLGIRCFGEQHHAVAEILMENPNNAAKVTRVLEKVFGIKLEIIPLEIDPLERGKLPVISRIEYRDENGKVTSKANNKAITIYCKSWENPSTVTLPAMRLCSIIGILREPYLCRDMISGIAKDRRTLARSVLKLAGLRAEKKDNTFVTFGTVNRVIDKRLPEVMEDLRAICTNSNSSDGFDFLSIAYLAVSLFLLDKNSNYTNIYTNGPVSYARGVLTVDRDALKGFKEYFRIPETYKSLRKLLKNYTGSPQFFPEYLLQEAISVKRTQKKAKAVS